jgi:hypothetical protein
VDVYWQAALNLIDLTKNAQPGDGRFAGCALRIKNKWKVAVFARGGIAASQPDPLFTLRLESSS